MGLHAYLPTRIVRLSAPLELNGTTIFLVEVILYGFVISSAATVLFHVYEGFRAPWVTRAVELRNAEKVQRLQAEIQGLFKRQQEGSERAQSIARYLTDFPYRKLDGGGFIFEAERPTRLGNLIAAYELYPENVYGVDGVYFWYHLNYLAPEAAKEDVDGKASWAESILLSSAAGAGVALAAAVFLIARVIGHFVPAIAFFPSPLTVRAACETLLFGAGAFGIFYYLSWPAYRDYRDSFRAMVDLAMPHFKEWLTHAQVPPPTDLQHRAAEVRRYLRELRIARAAPPGKDARRGDTPSGSRP